ncbi:uncharacterized protein [Miscanthus floridulus]|uniref:uncharacterized protein n=1 Tax=Miscanthus floridulus TaxID=154761 RepID=UPI0034596618
MPVVSNNWKSSPIVTEKMKRQATRIRELKKAGLMAAHVVELFTRWRLIPLKNWALACTYTEVDDKGLALRVKDMLETKQPVWTGVPEPYSAENPPPKDDTPFGPIPGGVEVNSDAEDGPEVEAAADVVGPPSEAVAGQGQPTRPKVLQKRVVTCPKTQSTKKSSGARSKKLKCHITLDPEASFPVESSVKESKQPTLPGASPIALSVYPGVHHPEIPHPEPSRIEAIAAELKVCQSLWQRDRDQASQSAQRLATLEAEVAVVKDRNDKQATLLERMLSEKAATARLIKDLNEKLGASEAARVAAEERHRAVEEKLIEGATTAVGHAIGVIKSRQQPDFDVGVQMHSG